MKKICLLIVLFSIVIPLFASITFKSRVSFDTEEMIKKAFNEAIGNRKDIDITIDKINLTDSDISFLINYGEKSIEFSSPTSLFQSEVNNLFYYEEELYLGGEQLDYIYSSSFSSVSLLKAKKGDIYSLRNNEGKKEALFVVSSLYDDATVLRALYQKNPKVGMRLKKENNFSFSLNAFSNIKFSDYGAMFNIYYSTFTFPFVPYFSVIYRSVGEAKIIPALGLKSEFVFSTVWSDVPFIRNMKLSGEVGLGLSLSKKTQLLGTYSVTLSAALSPNIDIAAGLLNVDGTKYILLSLGGRI